MRNRLWSIPLIAPIIASFGLRAQNSVDITLVPVQNNNLEVRFRFENDFDGYFAASVFTIRWSEASGASLGPVQQDAQVQEYHDVNASGPDAVSNGYHYQVYAGFGTSVLSDIPLTLMAGEWNTLCTIPVTGADNFGIVNDAFTATVNGDFYVSLGGQESQGDIIDFNTAVVGHAAGEKRLSVYPTITSGSITVETDARGANLLGFSLVNARGLEVWNEPWSGGQGPLRKEIDLSDLAAGVYIVRLRGLGGDHVSHVVKR